MKINIKKFKKNILFFLCSTLVLLLVLLLSVFFEKDYTLEEEELSDDKISFNKLVINEIMTSNRGAIVDEKGNLYDYLEIYNGNNKTINLKGYGLSDEANRIKYTFPSIELKSKEYVVVYLSGNNDTDMHAAFRLKSKGGEIVTLFKPNGKIVDSVKTVAVKKNSVMARNANGKWVIQSSATPGFENNKEGYKKFVESRKSTLEKTVVINEVLPNNKGLFKNKMYGEYSGFIELKNISDKTININGYSISNTFDRLYRFQLPNIDLKEGEIFLIYTSNRNVIDEEIHASFKLYNTAGAVILSDNNGIIIDSVEYEDLTGGNALVRVKNGYVKSGSISPGFENSDTGIKAFEKEFLKKPDILIINEVMNSNYSYMPQNQGNYYDWIELYNNSNNEINLKDYCLTNNTDTMCKSKLPDVKLKSGEYYILIASGNSNLSNNSYTHINFKISETESIFLTSSDKVVDSMHVHNIPIDYSYGRSGSYGFYYFSKPTPGSANKDGVMNVSFDVKPSKQAGIYKEAIEVELIGNGTIYYTLDGSTPNTYSHIYSSPLKIESTTVLKSRSYEEGMLPSKTTTATYLINPEHKLNIISISISPSDLKNLHNNAWVEKYLKPCHLEYFDKEGTGFSIPGALKLFGGATRGHPKKSYEVKFKKAYGKGSLEYKVFKNVDSSIFNSLVFRTGSQDEMGTASQKTLIRDIVGTALVREYTSVDVQDYVPVALYLNGSYWGLYFIREKVDESFVANHHNVNATKYNTDLLRIDNQVKSGSTKKYNQLLSYIARNNMSNSKHYDYVKTQINIENFCDLWIAETWTANNDIVNVRFFSHPDIDNGRWHYIFYDLDFAFYNVNRNYYEFSTNPSGMTVNRYSTFLLRNLMKNKEFRQTYLERLSYNMKNTWKEEVVLKKIDDVIAEIGEDEIKRNLKRWNMSYPKWQASVEKLKNYVRNRGKYMKTHAKSYFGLSDKEYKKYFGDV